MANTKCCHFCRDLSIETLVSLAKKEIDGYHSFPQQAFYQHQPSIDDLEASASNGCDLCDLILGCLCVSSPEMLLGTGSPEQREDQDCDLDESMYAVAKMLEVSSIKIAITADHLYCNEVTLPADCQLDTLLVQVGPRADDPAEYGMHWELPPLSLTLSLPVGKNEIFYVDGCRIGRSELNPDLSAPENFDIARGWLQRCRQEHTNCLTGCPHGLPTRVVDVGVEIDFRDLRIVHPHGEIGYYMALSHCWGGRITPLLTTETIQSFNTALPYSDLPANFQDAITITRELGVRYLWIDSLCIIQDSKDDWKVESMKMADVYRHAVVTISALSSPGSTHGIFPPNPRPISPTNTVKLSGRIESHEVNISRKNTKSEYLTALALKCPLYRRGWCLQEMVLSPRQLLYGEKQMYWQCPHGFRDAEGTGPGPGRRFPGPAFGTLASILYADILRPSSPARAEYDIDIVLTEYYNLVQDYSHRQLSFGSDKLPALAGIVQRLHRAIGGDYIAGLWSKDLHRGLSWRAEGMSTRHVKPSRAPSWSWAVTDEELLTVVGAEDVKRAGPDNPLSLKLIAHDLSLDKPYGAVASGTLVVHGLTRPMKFSDQVVDAQESKYNLGAVYFDENNYASDVASHDEMVMAGYSLFPITNDELLVVTTTRGANEYWEPDEGAIRSERYLLLLVHAEFDCHEEWTSERGTLLILQQKDSERCEEFERIGLVIMNPIRRTWLSRWIPRTINLV